MRTQNVAELSPGTRKCRFCEAELSETFVDLGVSPLCQTHVAPDQLHEMEPFYPLHAFVCSRCLLVQLQAFVSPGSIFTEYAYFSSYSPSWVEHARTYAERMVAQLRLDGSSLVVEIASNDGYLLQHFLGRSIPVLGIEPAANIAKVAVSKGIPTDVCFFGTETARRIRENYRSPDLLIGNNVLAHVPDLNDFVSGLKLLLSEQGVITMEFPHLLRLMERNQFDTIYHEHFSYFSFMAVERIFAHHGLRIFDVEELQTHGGSLRIFASHASARSLSPSQRVAELQEKEVQGGLTTLAGYRGFGERVARTKRHLLRFLIDAREAGKRVVGYGAPGKGNTLLNYCGIRTDLLEFTVDANPYKQGKFTPGTRIPILNPAAIREARPDYVLILPWNLREEISGQCAYIREWGGRFVVPIPELEIF